MTRTLRPWPRDPRFQAVDDGSIVGPSGRTLVPFLGRQGYPRINVYRAGRHSQHFVHVIVCEAFHGPRPPGHEVAHRNGDQLDARPANLEWKTHADNEADKIDHDTWARGERHGMARLGERDVLTIRESSESAAALAVRYSTTAHNIRMIRRGETWRYLL